MFLCLVAGIYSYNILGRSEDPVYTVKQMVISAAWPGATAKEMEMQVTDKIEKEAQTLPDIDYVTSYSRPGQCVVNVYLKEHVPTDKVRSHWLELRNIVNDIKTKAFTVLILTTVSTMYTAIYTQSPPKVSVTRICVKKPKKLNAFFILSPM